MGLLLWVILKKIKDLFEKCGNQTSERVAFQPFWNDYAKELESNIADLKNIGSSEAGSYYSRKVFRAFY